MSAWSCPGTRLDSYEQDNCMARQDPQDAAINRPRAEEQLSRCRSVQKWEAPSGCGWDDPCGSGCDSSNCLFCQQSAVPHFSDTQLCQRLASGSFSPTEFAAAAVPGDLDPELLHERKRARIAGSSDISTSHSHLQVLAPSELPSGWRFRAEWTSRNTPAPACFQHLATYSTPTSSHHMNCNILCGMEFTRDGMLLAAAGIAKQVRLYSLEQLASGQQVVAQPAAVLRMPSKISCASWSPDAEGVITIGDYDGGLSQVHVVSGHLLADLDAHCGRRVWGLAHSLRQPLLCASVSDDRTCRLWRGPALAQEALTIQPPSNHSLCGVDFSSSRDNLLSLASSDASVYLYDIRQAGTPLASLQHHRRPVSYVKFFGATGLVSASVDGTLAWWDVAAALGAASMCADSSNGAAEPPLQQQGDIQRQGHSSSTGSRQRGADSEDEDGMDRREQRRRRQCATPRTATPTAATPSTSASWRVLSQPLKVFQGHRNEKNFVGLAVRPEDGLMACGSESQEVFTYHTSWSQPLARRKVARPVAGQQDSSSPFVSAVAWQPAAAAERLGWPALLAAGTSAGDVELLALVDPPGGQ